jgi:hypothetical protein
LLSRCKSTKDREFYVPFERVAPLSTNLNQECRLETALNRAATSTENSRPASVGRTSPFWHGFAPQQAQSLVVNIPTRQRAGQTRSPVPAGLADLFLAQSVHAAAVSAAAGDELAPELEAESGSSSELRVSRITGSSVMKAIIRISLPFASGATADSETISILAVFPG